MDFSWVLATVGVTGMVIAGRNIWWGWALNLGNELLWIIFAVVTKQYGFILMAVGYGAVYAHNAHNWKGNTSVHRQNQRGHVADRRPRPMLRVHCLQDVRTPTRPD